VVGRLTRLRCATVKDLLRRVLSSGLRWRARLSARPAGLAIVYHGLADRPGDPARELSAPHGRAQFRAQMAHLAAHYRPVAPSQLQAATARRKRGERIPVAVTFDDDLRSHVEIAAPELRAAGVPAAFFLTGASLEAASEFWWGPVQRAADRGLLDDGAGAAVAERIGVEWAPEPAEPPLRTLARPFERARAPEREAALARLVAFVGEDGGEPGLRAADVRALADDGFEIGFHTRRHVRLDQLGDEADVRAAVTEGREAVEAAAGAPVRAFSYPHGGVDARAAAAVRAAGYAAAFTSVSKPVTPDTDPALLGRFYPT
jgi:peptidoglycan/xylan/chitin deacetylase (PgdA/CDA1 family)